MSEAEQQKDQLFQEKVRINSELNEARQKLEYEQNRLKEKQNDLDSLKRKNQLLIVYFFNNNNNIFLFFSRLLRVY